MDITDQYSTLGHYWLLLLKMSDATFYACFQDHNAKYITLKSYRCVIVATVFPTDTLYYVWQFQVNLYLYYHYIKRCLHSQAVQI